MKARCPMWLSNAMLGLGVFAALGILVGLALLLVSPIGWTLGTLLFLKAVGQ